ncbi:hypothetical protein [Psychromonas antarctica]|uniref:hypothetical protein n=1 Tax=Psychromonas antarctica TaxID=67573 RepID=UPI001EE8D686|nr:hypothetical protein [Psychromonas antarctica]MCG6202248.1 hypothetical protein [Psychromonas antarctica]
MTSWPLPTHSLCLQLDSANQQCYSQLADNTFYVQLYRNKRAYPLKAMIILPQNQSGEALKMLNVMLWLSSDKAIVQEGEQVVVELIEECDPMNSFSKHHAQITKLLPATFKGNIFCSISHKENNEIPKDGGS